MPSREAAGAAARKLLTSLEAPIGVGGEELRIACSVGIAFQPGDGVTAEHLVRAATLAVDAARRHGGGRIGSFSGLLLDPAPGLYGPRAASTGQHHARPVPYPGAHAADIFA